MGVSSSFKAMPLGDAMRLTIAAISMIMLAGCAGPDVPITARLDGTFFVSKTASTGFAGMGNPFVMKNAVLSEATAFCGAQKKTMKTINMDATAPPFIMGNYPQADLTLTCE